MPTRWKMVEDLRAQLDPIVEEPRRMSTQDALKERGRHALIAAVHRFDGRRTVARTLGYS